MAVEGIEVVVSPTRADHPIELNVTGTRVDYAGFVFTTKEAADLGGQLVAAAFKAGLIHGGEVDKKDKPLEGD